MNHVGQVRVARTLFLARGNTLGKVNASIVGRKIVAEQLRSVPDWLLLGSNHCMDQHPCELIFASFRCSSGRRRAG